MSEEFPGNATDKAKVEPHFFVSYSQKDKSVAMAFCKELANRQVPLWIDDKLKAGPDWDDQVVDAIEASRGSILLLSRASNSSREVKRELYLNRDKPIVIVRLDDTELSKKLAFHGYASHRTGVLRPPFDKDELDRLAADLRDIVPPPRKRRRGLLPTRCGLAALLALASVYSLGKLAKRNDERGDESGHKYGVWARQVISNLTLYNTFATGGNDKLSPRTTLIEVNDQTVHGVVNPDNLCKEREYYGALLGTLAALTRPPKVVILDKVYGMRECSGTVELLRGIKALCTKGSIVVVARHADFSDTEAPIHAIDPSLDFRGAGASCVWEAMDDLDVDYRQVRLKLPDLKPGVLRNPDWLSGGAPLSLPFAAAKAAKLTNHEDMEFEKHISDRSIVSLLEPTELTRIIYANAESVCKGKERFIACAEPGVAQASLSMAEDRVVIVGDNWESWSEILKHPEFDDEHITVAGPMPGYKLQANYIESLLESRYVRWPVPDFINWFAGLAIFAAFEYLLFSQGVVRGLGYSAVLMAVTVLTIYFASRNHWYFAPTPTAILAILYSQALRGLILLLPSAWGIRA
jgi:hypothetical protein